MKIILNFALNCEFKIPMFSISIWRGACKYHKWINYCLKLVKHVWIQTLFLNLHFSSQGFLNHFLYAEFWIPIQLLRTYEKKKKGISFAWIKCYNFRKSPPPLPPTTTTTTKSLMSSYVCITWNSYGRKRYIYNWKFRKLWKIFALTFALLFNAKGVGLSLRRNEIINGKTIFTLACVLLIEHGSTEVIGQVFQADSLEMEMEEMEPLLGSWVVPTWHPPSLLQRPHNFHGRARGPANILTSLTW